MVKVNNPTITEEKVAQVPGQLSELLLAVERLEKQLEILDGRLSAVVQAIPPADVTAEQPMAVFVPLANDLCELHLRIGEVTRRMVSMCDRLEL